MPYRCNSCSGGQHDHSLLQPSSVTPLSCNNTDAPGSQFSPVPCHCNVTSRLCEFTQQYSSQEVASGWAGEAALAFPSTHDCSGVASTTVALGGYTRVPPFLQQLPQNGFLGIGPGGTCTLPLAGFRQHQCSYLLTCGPSDVVPFGTAEGAWME